jgi:hypothetical protein
MRDVARGQAVELELARHGRWTARVEAVLPDRLVVAAYARVPAATWGGLSGVPADVTITTPRGLVHAPGLVLAADRAGVIEIALNAEPRVDQRRDHVRVPSRLPGLVAPRDGSLPPLHTFTLDVSGGGVLIAGAAPADVGAPVEVTIKLPGSDPLRTDGRIARRTDEGHVALVFDGIAEPDREALVRWIFERQRLDRKAAREGQ